MRSLVSRVRSFLAGVTAKPQREPRLAVEELTDRINPSTILWANQFTNSNFDAVYGANAAAARGVVNQAIADWQNAIPNFNYHSPSLNNTFVVNITAASLDEGLLGETNPPTPELSSLKPIATNIRLDDDANGLGWFFDPTPWEDSEFTDVQNRYTAHNNFSGYDLYQAVAHELGHALGFVIHQGLAIDSRLDPDPLRGVPYVSEHWLYNLVAPGRVVATFTPDGHTYGGDSLSYAANYNQEPGSVVKRDLMNPSVRQQTRQLISEHDLDVLETAYGYTVNKGALRSFASPAHEIGTFRPPQAANETGRFDLLLPNGSTATVPFWPTDTRAVVGDWDGDGYDDLGSYHAPTGKFHLWFLNTGNVYEINFGGPNSYPVAGDWDGDGRDDIGVYFPNAARFDLLVLSTGVAFSVGSFGSSSYIPVAGDWDGDGVDDLGLYDPTQALFRIRARDGTKTSISMGSSAALPMAGDWDGDGDDEVGTYNRSTGRFALRSNNNPADPTRTLIDFGPINSVRLPVAGNWG